MSTSSLQGHTINIIVFILSDLRDIMEIGRIKNDSCRIIEKKRGYKKGTLKKLNMLGIIYFTFFQMKINCKVTFTWMGNSTFSFK